MDGAAETRYIEAEERAPWVRGRNKVGAVIAERMSLGAVAALRNSLLIQAYDVVICRGRDCIRT